MKHFGKIKNLKIDFLDEERFVEDLLKFEGKDIVFTINEQPKQIMVEVYGYTWAGVGIY